MVITRKTGIKECKKLWKEIEESGLSKIDFLFSPAGKKWIKKEYEGNCPLCECSVVCENCPFVTQYDKDCVALGYNGDEISNPSWFEAVRGLEESQLKPMKFKIKRK